MPKKAKPKMPKAMSASQQDEKPPTIDDAKDAVLESLICWAWYLNPFHNFNEDEYYLERIFENHDTLVAFEQQQSGRSFDGILDMQTNWLNMRVVEIVHGIGSMIHGIALSQKPDINRREDVVKCAAEIGLPSRHYEALSIFNLATRSKLKPEEKEKYPGLKNLFERMHKEGARPPTKNQVAVRYKGSCGWDSGLETKTIVHHIKNNSNRGVWTGPKYQSKKTPG
jgi:hypothetical protein